MTPLVEPPRHCDVCGSELPSRRKRFCSDRCKYRWWWAAKSADPTKREAHRVRDRERKRRQYRDRIAARPPAESRVCPVCSSTFPVSGAGQVYCSWACNRAARNKRRRESAPTVRTQVLVMATVWRLGVCAPLRMRVSGEVTVGIMAFCPECGDVLYCLSPRTAPSRSCLRCGTEVALDQAAVAQVLARTPSPWDATQ